MTDPRTLVTFEADGKNWGLRYSTNAMIRYEMAAGEDILTAFEVLQQGKLDLIRFRRMFWAGLVGGGNEIDEDAAGDLIDLVTLEGALRLLTQALLAALPRQSDEGSAEGNAPAPRAAVRRKPKAKD